MKKLLIIILFASSCFAESNPVIIWNASCSSGAYNIASRSCLVSGGSVVSFTPGSVIFADSSGGLFQDNSQIFWDDTDFQLGVGTNNPAGILDVEGGSFSSGAGQGINLIAGPSTMGGQGAGSIVIETQSSGGVGDGNITLRDGSGNGLSVNGGASSLQGGSGGASIQSSSDHLILNTSGKGAELSAGTNSSIILGSALTELGHLSTTYGIGFGSSDAGGESPVINVLSESASNPPLLDLWRTSATAGLVTSGMDLGQINWGGAYTTSGGKASHAVYHTSAHMDSLATQNWSATHLGSNLTFSVVPNNSTTPAEAMRVDQNGFVGLGTSAPAQELDVNGLVRIAVQAASATPACAGGTNGTMAFTSLYVLCVCNGASFVRVSDGSTACVF